MYVCCLPLRFSLYVVWAFLPRNFSWWRVFALIITTDEGCYYLPIDFAFGRARRLRDGGELESLVSRAFYGVLVDSGWLCACVWCVIVSSTRWILSKSTSWTFDPSLAACFFALSKKNVEKRFMYAATVLYVAIGDVLEFCGIFPISVPRPKYMNE